MNDVLLSVGSNINPVENIRRAELILAREHILVDATEAMVTKPVGYQYQPDFLNSALYLRASLDFESLNRYLKGVEKRLGRVKTAIKSGPRTIDLDIVVWNDRIVRQQEYDRYEYVRLPIDELAARHGIWLRPEVAVGLVR